ncbi:DUF4142 domain-containing protein [Ramlibacter sp.]|uniref:DUF4142 domain-containing protein n=1 Tax=Ramlibacter sp. TaxID=1917967 RepID=UPI002CB80A87|nr:DUF4142 domain-containing protein [Ramlibacter sp.]HWI81826.1 DUF4142 domain-containing protein [Ramlibacter sp.]
MTQAGRPPAPAPMPARTHRPRFLACWLAAGAFVAGCAPMPEQPVPHAVVASQPPSSERSVMARVAAAGLYDIEVSRLAASRATSPRVRSFAQAVVDHRRQSREQLAALMRARGIAVPGQLAADKATKLRRLAALKPSPDFDAAYVRVVGIEDQAAHIALLERTRRATRDGELALWIDRTLPVLRRDLQSAQQLAG